MVRSDLVAVKFAVDVGFFGTDKVGEVVSRYVISRPHSDVEKILSVVSGDKVE